MVVKSAREHEGRALLQVLDDLRQGAQGCLGITVRILAAADHDGVCAAKILVAILQRANVKHAVEPVTGNSQIIELVRTLKEDDDVRSLVLLNCGASLDMQRQLEDCEVSEAVRCYIFDAHRPMMLANMKVSHERVVVVDDDPVAEASGAQPPVGDSDDEENSEEDEDSEAEKENLWDPEVAGGLPPAHPDRLSSKRRRIADRQEKIEAKRTRVSEYYQSAYYATPAAVSLFKMAKQAAPPSQDLLWVAAVSLTGYYDLGQISKLEYEKLAWEELKEALDRTDDFGMDNSGGGGLFDGPDPSPEDRGTAPASPMRSAPRRTLRSAMEPRRLRFEADLRLNLYKHWNLEESMMHSAYFYGTMELHRDKGQRAMKAFFSTAGIYPQDYRQLYSGVPLSTRRNLHQRYRQHGKDYGLVDSRMFLQQFVRELGVQESNALFLHELNAMDAAGVITSMLASVPGQLSGNRLDHLPRGADDKVDTVAVNEIERQAMVENFWRAYDAVLCKEPGPLKEGIELAVETAKAVQSVARLLKDSKAMHCTRHFRWVKMEQPPPAFRHHLTVRRLAKWLLQVLFEYRPKGEGPDRPLLVIVRDRVRDTYLVVGATPTELGEQDEFGNRFRAALRADRSLRYRYDFFDKSCIEVAADDFERFWDCMCNAHSA